MSSLVLLVHKFMVTHNVRKAYEVACIKSGNKSYHDNQWMVLSCREEPEEATQGMFKVLAEDKADQGWAIRRGEYPSTFTTRNSEAPPRFTCEMAMSGCYLNELNDALQFVTGGVDAVKELAAFGVAGISDHIAYANAVHNMFGMNLNIRDPRIRKIKVGF
ncbi:hypothetical protein MYOV003v1_p0077 [Vibrio phage 207E48.1]|nr:hypothetical protein MYOV003v1_p0077 [Vibrio phage 207E48.1]